MSVLMDRNIVYCTGMLIRDWNFWLDCAFMCPFTAKEDILTKLKFVACLSRLTERKKLINKLKKKLKHSLFRFLRFHLMCTWIDHWHNKYQKNLLVCGRSQHWHVSVYLEMMHYSVSVYSDGWFNSTISLRLFHSHTHTHSLILSLCLTHTHLNMCTHKLTNTLYYLVVLDVSRKDGDEGDEASFRL